MRYTYPRRPAPRFVQPSPPFNRERCTRTPDGKHRWITSCLLPDGTRGPLPYPTCEECLEIDEIAGKQGEGQAT
jgi:hypothetical protein